MTPALVIVPDGFSQTAREILMNNQTCLLDTRVLTLPMLFNLLHGEVETLDNKTAALYMWRACLAVSKRLTWFKRSARQYPFAEIMLETLTALRESRTNPPGKSPKFCDIQTIRSEYDHLTANRTDTPKMMEWLIKNIPGNKTIAQSAVTMMGFEDMTVQQTEIAHLLRTHASGYNVFTFKPGNATRFIVKSDNIYHEAAQIANQIRHITSQGARYRDITVIIPPETAPIFAHIFAEDNIPYNTFDTQKLLDHPDGRRVLSALDSNPQIAGCKTASDFCTALLRDCPATVSPIIASISEILGTTPITLPEFTTTLRAQLNRPINKPEVYADRVTITTFHAFRPHPVPYLFVAGACEGAFPPVQSDTGLITEQDNIAIDGVHQQNARAHTRARQILESATRQIHISFSPTNLNSEHTFPSELVQSSFKAVKPAPEHFASPIYARRRSLHELGSGEAFRDHVYWSSVLAATDSGGIAVPVLNPPFANLTCGAALFLPDNTARVTQLENFAKCPYYHFLLNGLGVRPRRTKDPDPADIGTILHKFAELFSQNIKSDPDTIFTQACAGYNLPAFARTALQKRCRQIAKHLEAEISANPYQPTLFEFSVSKPIDGIILRGVIDRVDTKTVDGKTHAVAVDYKSGAVSAPKLQLPIYMDFLPSGLVPDGGYYLSLKTFKKHPISAEETAPALATAREILEKIKSGVIAPNPLSPHVCRYCPAGAMCRYQPTDTEEEADA